MIVDWNKGTFDRYLSNVFDVRPSWKISLLSDFTVLKSSRFGVIPSIFGKDGPYIKPQSIATSGLYHVHLLLDKNSRKGSNQLSKTSDSALVYTRHKLIDDFYSLLAIFPVKAHQFCNDNGIMIDLAAHARKFQSLTASL